MMGEEREEGRMREEEEEDMVMLVLGFDMGEGLGFKIG